MGTEKLELIRQQIRKATERLNLDRLSLREREGTLIPVAALIRYRDWMLAEIDEWIRDVPSNIAEVVPTRFRGDLMTSIERELRIMREDFRSTVDGYVSRLRSE